MPTLSLFHFEHAELTARPLEAPGLERQVFVVRRSDRPLSAAAQALYELLMAKRPRPAPVRKRAGRAAAGRSA